MARQAENSKIPWWRTDLGEEEIRGVAEAMRARRITQGPIGRELEGRIAEELGVPHVVVTTSGSVALLLALLASDVGPGDEVVVPALTFIAPAHAALLLGANVKLVDVQRDRPLMDAGCVAAAITERTKAVIAVHLNGRACDVAAVKAAVADASQGRPIAVIEDAAQSFLSKGEEGGLGTLADIGSFSMGLTKLITTGEGGFVATREQAMSRRLVGLRNHGTAVIADNVFPTLGHNFRLTDMQAAIGLVQLAKVGRKIEAVERVYRAYEAGLAGLAYARLLDVRVGHGEVPLWTEVLCSERDAVVAALARRGIEAKSFHPCLAASPHVRARGEFPNAERFASLGITLPSGPDQPEADVARVIDALHEIAGEISTELDS